MVAKRQKITQDELDERCGIRQDDVDLSNLDLRGLSLANFELGQNTNFSNSDLTGVDMTMATLPCADFSHAVLTGANFSRADMPYANLSGTILDDVVGKKANLANSFLNAVHANGLDLKGANLRGASMAGAVLSDARLEGCDMDGVSLDASELTRCSLYGVFMPKGTAVKTAFVDCDLCDAVFRGSNFQGATLDGCGLVGSDIAKVTGLSRELAGRAAIIAAFPAVKELSAVFRDVWHSATLSRPSFEFNEKFPDGCDVDDGLDCPQAQWLKEKLAVDVSGADLSRYVGGFAEMAGYVLEDQDALFGDFVEEWLKLAFPSTLVDIAAGSEMPSEALQISLGAFVDWKGQELAAGRTHGLDGEALGFEMAAQGKNRGQEDDVEVPMLGDTEAVAPDTDHGQAQGLGL